MQFASSTYLTSLYSFSLLSLHTHKMRVKRYFRLKFRNFTHSFERLNVIKLTINVYTHKPERAQILKVSSGRFCLTCIKCSSRCLLVIPLFFFPMFHRKGFCTIFSEICLIYSMKTVCFVYSDFTLLWIKKTETKNQFHFVWCMVYVHQRSCHLHSIGIKTKSKKSNKSMKMNGNHTHAWI